MDPLKGSADCTPSLAPQAMSRPHCPRVAFEATVQAPVGSKVQTEEAPVAFSAVEKASPISLPPAHLTPLSATSTLAQGQKLPLPKAGPGLLSQIWRRPGMV